MSTVLASSSALPGLTAFPALQEEARLLIPSLARSERLEYVCEALDMPLSTALDLLASQHSMRVVHQNDFDLETLSRLPVRLVHEYHCVPVHGEGAGCWTLATSWPPEEGMEEWVYAACGQEVEWVLAPPDKLSRWITENLGVGAESLDDANESVLTGPEAAPEAEEDENAAIIRFVNQVMAQAVEDGATDIHFEPMEETLRIRYRIDGLLVSVPLPDNLRRIQDAIISRLKIMAKLNISEKRLPQDGRINYKSASTTLDIRVSTIPTMYGESVSLRLLNKKSNPLSLRQLGMPSDDQAVIDRVLGLPHGIILVTGPTGSGKSTSLNAFIRQINSTDKRIITVEDPIEYEVPGVNQIQVRPEIGLGFAEALRHILRQDPNVIMVGEIRDRDTADIAIRASLTGHLVFSTLHTNDAAGALTRLVDMGIEPFLVASGVEMIIAQRLVRRLCQDCRKMVPVDRASVETSLRLLDLDPALAVQVESLPEAVGCELCRFLGYRGRIGLFEILRVTDELHDLVLKRVSAHEIRKEALKYGMRTLQDSGWRQVCAGYTSLEEVVRVISMADGTD